MLSLRTLAIAHNWIARVIKEGDTTIDATAGNGYDTLFLAQCVGDKGKVYAFDVQGEAIKQTKDLLEDEGWLKGKDYLPRVSLHQCCHSKLAEHCVEKVSAIMFNLGYLPNSDKSVITEKDTTLYALDKALSLISEGGLLTIVCYPGHEGGAAEASAVDEWASSLYSTQYNVLKVNPHNTRSKAPYLLGIQKGRI